MLQWFSMALDCAAFLDDDFRQCASAVDCLSELTYCSIQSCMVVQVTALNPLAFAAVHTAQLFTCALTQSCSLFSLLLWLNIHTNFLRRHPLFICRWLMNLSIAAGSCKALSRRRKIRDTPKSPTQTPCPWTKWTAISALWFLTVPLLSLRIMVFWSPRWVLASSVGYFDCQFSNYIWT